MSFLMAADRHLLLSLHMREHLVSHLLINSIAYSSGPTCSFLLIYLHVGGVTLSYPHCLQSIRVSNKHDVHHGKELSDNKVVKMHLNELNLIITLFILDFLYSTLCLKVAYPEIWQRWLQAERGGAVPSHCVRSVASYSLVCQTNKPQFCSSLNLKSTLFFTPRTKMFFSLFVLFVIGAGTFGI